MASSLLYGVAPFTSNSFQSTLEVQLRIHVLESTSDIMRADISKKEIKTLLEGANEVWAQAGIQWKAESIRTINIGDANEVTEFVKNPGSMAEGKRILTQTMPTEPLLSKGWNLFLVNSLGPSGGVYLQEIGAAVFPVNSTIGRHPQILAHELGHALGLRHTPADGENLMQGRPKKNQDPSLRDPAKAIYLNPEQIQVARNQAKTGKTYRR